MIVHNLSNNESAIFSNDAKELHAVCQCWASENNKLTQWTALAQDDAGIEEYKRAGFPVIPGRVTIACGDWTTF